MWAPLGDRFIMGSVSNRTGLFQLFRSTFLPIFGVGFVHRRIVYGTLLALYIFNIPHIYIQFQIVIATPGRLIDVLENRYLVLS